LILNLFLKIKIASFFDFLSELRVILLFPDFETGVTTYELQPKVVDFITNSYGIDKIPWKIFFDCGICVFLCILQKSSFGHHVKYICWIKY